MNKQQKEEATLGDLVVMLGKIVAELDDISDSLHKLAEAVQQAHDGNYSFLNTYDNSRK